MKRSQGFTLLELLIGMTLLGFIMSLAFSAFRLASTTWDAVSSRTESVTDEQLARSFARRLLEQVQPIRWKKAINQQVTFLGTAEALRAVVPLSGPLGAGGMNVIELSAGRSGKESRESGSLRFVLRRAPLHYGDASFTDTLSNAEESVLLEGLQEVEFSYFGVEKPGAPPGWQSSWSSMEQLPQLVRIRLKSPELDWADLIVAPMVTGTSCRWDSFYKRCR